MMTPTKLISRLACFFLIGITCFACHDEYPDPPIKEMYICHHEAQWDQPEIQGHLIATWRREYVYCVGRTSRGFDVQDEGFKITFMENGMLTAIRQDSLFYTGSWLLDHHGEDHYTVITEPSLYELEGGLLICEDYIMFNASSYDLCDNYFKRIP